MCSHNVARSTGQLFWSDRHYNNPGISHDSARYPWVNIKHPQIQWWYSMLMTLAHLLHHRIQHQLLFWVILIVIASIIAGGDIGGIYSRFLVLVKALASGFARNGGHCLVVYAAVVVHRLSSPHWFSVNRFFIYLFFMMTSDRNFWILGLWTLSLLCCLSSQIFGHYCFRKILCPFG